MIAVLIGIGGIVNHDY